MCIFGLLVQSEYRTIKSFWLNATISRGTLCSQSPHTQKYKIASYMYPLEAAACLSRFFTIACITCHIGSVRYFFSRVSLTACGCLEAGNVANNPTKKVEKREHGHRAGRPSLPFAFILCYSTYSKHTHLTPSHVPRHASSELFAQLHKVMNVK